MQNPHHSLREPVRGGKLPRPLEEIHLSTMQISTHHPSHLETTTQESRHTWHRVYLCWNIGVKLEGNWKIKHK